MSQEPDHRILVLDDDADWLNVCREVLAHLPSRPEIHTAMSGMDALSLLDAQPFRVLICDLVMPQMDGLEVLGIVRRRFPGLRTVVLTAHPDGEFRAGAYELGVDLFWLKTDLPHKEKMFLDCLESLLGPPDDTGFHDVHGKNLLDVIRMECALGNSSVLRLASEKRMAQIWIQNGQVIDAWADGAEGEAAFRHILDWKEGGTFESLPAEAFHFRTIEKSVEALVSEHAQSVKKIPHPTEEQREEETKLVTHLVAVAGAGAEFVITVPDKTPPVKKENTVEGWGTAHKEPLAAWTHQVRKAAQRISRRLNAGPCTHVLGIGLERHLLLLPQKDGTFVAGWPPQTDPGQLFEQTKELAETWAS